MTEPTARIEAALSQIGSEHEPPAGWEARVLAATGTPARRPWWLYSSAALAVGSAILVVTLISDGAAALALDLSYPKPRDAVATRAGEDSPQLGGTMRARARGGGYRSVWVYRDNELVVACPGTAGACEYTGDATIATVQLTAIGEYTAIALSSVVPVPPPRGALDTDVFRAKAAGASVSDARQVVR
ncbi:MAG TPA: hypothetical protein VFT22_33000 [Kofleriaceae bacterium]|nr:hypothetical protein [Kofleriaceae bacterium]